MVYLKVPPPLYIFGINLQLEWTIIKCRLWEGCMHGTNHIFGTVERWCGAGRSCVLCALQPAQSGAPDSAAAADQAQTDTAAAMADEKPKVRNGFCKRGFFTVFTPSVRDHCTNDSVKSYTWDRPIAFFFFNTEKATSTNQSYHGS